MGTCNCHIKNHQLQVNFVVVVVEPLNFVELVEAQGSCPICPMVNPALPCYTPLQVCNLSFSFVSVLPNCIFVISNHTSILYTLDLSIELREKNLQTFFCSLVIAKLTCASPAWWGFANADVRCRIQTFIRRSIKAGFCPSDSPSFQDLCENADDKLFRCLTSVDTHSLRIFLPSK